MNIALVLAPSYNPNTPPLSLAYLKSYIQDKDVKVRCFDLNIDLYSRIDPKDKSLWNDIDALSWVENNKFNLLDAGRDGIINEWVDKIMSFKPRIVGFSTYNTNHMFSAKLAEMIKKIDKDIFVIFGGPEISMYRFNFEIQHLKFLDAIILGEGEEAARKLVISIKENGFIAPEPGTLVKIGGCFAGDGECKLIDSMDSIPFPSYEDFDITKYKEPGQLPLLFSRGCIGKCAFCFERVFWRKYRHRSCDNIIKEIENILTRYNRDIFNFAINDSLINGDLRLLQEFCDAVIKKKLNIGWWGMARIDARMDKKYIKKMFEAGCRSLAFGVESGSQKVVDLMKKGYNLKDIETCIIDTKKAGIKVGISLLMGFPGEEEDDFKKTCGLVERLGQCLSYVNISTLGIIPLTPIERDKFKLGINADIKDSRDWSNLEGTNNLSVRLDRLNRLSGVVDKYVSA